MIGYRGNTEKLGACANGQGKGGGAIINGKFTTVPIGEFVLNPPLDGVDDLTISKTKWPGVVRLFLFLFLNARDLFITASFGIYIPQVVHTV